jgi:hypothetical protein
VHCEMLPMQTHMRSREAAPSAAASTQEAVVQEDAASRTLKAPADATSQEADSTEDAAVAGDDAAAVRDEATAEQGAAATVQDDAAVVGRQAVTATLPKAADGEEKSHDEASAATSLPHSTVERTEDLVEERLLRKLDHGSSACIGSRCRLAAVRSCLARFAAR